MIVECPIRQRPYIVVGWGNRSITVIDDHSFPRIVGPILIGFVVAALWKLWRACDEEDGVHLVALPAILGAFGLSLLLENLNMVAAHEPAWMLAALSGALTVEGLRRT